MGELAAIGIVKGKPFAPDKRMRRILEQAAAVGTAASRALLFEPRASEEFEYDDGSAWENNMWVGGYDFETPPPLVTDDGIKPFHTTGIRALHSRTAWFYGYTGVTPAMCMRLTGVGSHHVFAFKDVDGSPLDGAQTYQVTLPPDIPAARFWFGPERPSDSPESNWIQTTEGKGWFPILRLYSPLASFFEKTWRPSEIEPLA